MELNTVEYFLNRLPDRIVADDIKNYLDKKTETHLFSNIYKGRTILSPNLMIENFSNADSVALYGGGWGMGNYIEVRYSIKEKKYMYYYTSGAIGEGTHADFESEDWTEFYTYVRKDLLDTFIHFNPPKKVTSVELFFINLTRMLTCA